MKTLVGDLNSKMVKEDISKQRIRNESLRKSSNANGIKVVNFATSKYLVVKGTYNVPTSQNLYILASPDGRTYSQTDQSPDRWKMTVKYI
jgi:hypothetical protein